MKQTFTVHFFYFLYMTVYFCMIQYRHYVSIYLHIKIYKLLRIFTNSI